MENQGKQSLAEPYMEKTVPKGPTIKWKNKIKQSESVHKSDKIDASTINGKTTINQKCLNKKYIINETNLSIKNQN